ncbi:hypothetical protein GFS24_20860 [Chitinophaga sp. SYP-B3965]|uniref:hypothetical protein n=1 Tax=Chitinophaga sp. SYP-B3965 TaxID=2663120 RepID=UPI001299A4A4|nr:hypothetical protein [Chitinophaga sp. SYP-B3965]MRG47586.1 hypothetical protein [Chitinophaga sp. SYP-B3965]
MLKQDKLSLGILLGLLTPAVAFFIYYLGVFLPKDLSLGDFFDLLKGNKQLIPKVISICLLANGIVFYLYTRVRRDLTARGIFLVTLLYAIVILLLKII